MKFKLSCNKCCRFTCIGGLSQGHLSGFLFNFWNGRFWLSVLKYSSLNLIDSESRSKCPPMKIGVGQRGINKILGSSSGVYATITTTIFLYHFFLLLAFHLWRALASLIFCNYRRWMWILVQNSALSYLGLYSNKGISHCKLSLPMLSEVLLLRPRTMDRSGLAILFSFISFILSLALRLLYYNFLSISQIRNTLETLMGGLNSLVGGSSPPAGYGPE